MKTKSKTKNIIDGVVSVILILCSAVWYFQFTKTGYMLSVPYRSSFEKIAENVYVNKGNAMTNDEILKTIHEAEERDREFFGELTYEAETTIIVNDNEKLQKKLGDGKATNTLRTPKKHDYISLSNQYFNLDIIAHEITHAELHKRLTSRARREIPIWFDEGIATQNDYREQYSIDNWIRRTDNGKNLVPLDEMDESSEFYCEDINERQFHYIIAKHEVRRWMEKNKKEGLMYLIDRLNDGKPFDAFFVHVQ